MGKDYEWAASGALRRGREAGQEGGRQPDHCPWVLQGTGLLMHAAPGQFLEPSALGEGKEAALLLGGSWLGLGLGLSLLSPPLPDLV